MSQIKEKTRESEPDAVPDEGPRGVAQRAALLSRLRSLLDERTRLLEHLEHVDRQIERLRDEASDEARREAACLSESPDDRSFSIAVGDFLAGAVEPPADVEREDFARCLDKVVRALHRRGESLATAVVLVRYRPRSGRVVAIALRTAGDEGERRVYRRFALGASGAPGA